MNKTIEIKHLLWILYCLKYLIYYKTKIAKKSGYQNRRMHLLTIKLSNSLVLNYIFWKKKLAHAYFRRRIFSKFFGEKIKIWTRVILRVTSASQGNFFRKYLINKKIWFCTKLIRKITRQKHCIVFFLNFGPRIAFGWEI